MKDIGLNYFVVRERKLDASFKSQQFLIEDFDIRARIDRDGTVGL